MTVLSLPMTPNQRRWTASVIAMTPSRPPYPVDMPVTPLSTFADSVWEFPLDWIAVNNRARRELDFRSSATFADGTSSCLDAVRDAALVRQLKEATWASLHRREHFEGRRRSRIVKPGGAWEILRRLRRLFSGFRHLGCASLRDVTPVILVDALALLGTTGGELEKLAQSFQDLMTFSREGLIHGGLREARFEIAMPHASVEDATAPLGWQPFSDEEVASLIKTSNAYIDLADDIVCRLRALRADPRVHAEVLQWAVEKLPCGTRMVPHRLEAWLVSLVQVSAANLISFLGGLRVSELLSIRQGFVTVSDGAAVIELGRLTLEFTTHKTVASFHGERRMIVAHPRMADVARALQAVKDAADIPGDYLIVPLGQDLPGVTTSWNYELQRFCDVHELPIDISSHRWRKTVAAVAVRVLTGSTLHLKELFGHVGLGMTARYILASPFIREEIRDLTLDVYRKRGRSLLESLSALGGTGVGGVRGQDLEARFFALLGSDVTEVDLRLQLDDFVEDMLQQGMFVVPVMPGVMCTKPAAASGVCASSSGDRLADPARCSARCSYQVQESNRRDLVAWMIRRAAVKRGTWSRLEERYWAEQCRDQLVAWPDLRAELLDVTQGWPALGRALGGEG